MTENENKDNGTQEDLKHASGSQSAVDGGVIKPGDKVATAKGCRIAGNPGELTVIETGKKWGSYDAVVCEKPDGSRRLFLLKNLKAL